MEREEANFHLKETESHHSPHIFASLFWHEEKGPVSYSCKLAQASPTAKGCHNRDPPVPTGCCKAASPAHIFYFTPTHRAKFLLMSTSLLSQHHHLPNRGCELHLPQPLTRGRVPPPLTLTCVTMWVMSPVLAGSRTVLESLASLEKAFTYCSATEREAAALPCCGETARAQHEGGSAGHHQDLSRARTPSLPQVSAKFFAKMPGGIGEEARCHPSFGITSLCWHQSFGCPKEPSLTCWARAAARS